jgi:two-component sensor histidine kinase
MGIPNLVCKPGRQGRAFANLSTSRNAVVLNVRAERQDIEIPGTTAVSLGFIVTELLTNAVKHGNGPIVVNLDSDPAKGYALSVSNDGPPLPEGFNPAKCTGLGMRLIGVLVRRIRGEFAFGLGQNNQGARFIVLFS